MLDPYSRQTVINLANRIFTKFSEQKWKDMLEERNVTYQWGNLGSTWLNSTSGKNKGYTMETKMIMSQQQALITDKANHALLCHLMKM